MSIVIAYKYEADIHCVNCARLRFEAKKGQRADGNGWPWRPPIERATTWVCGSRPTR